MKILMLEDEVSSYKHFQRFVRDLRDAHGNAIDLVFVRSIGEFKTRFGKSGSEYSAVVLDNNLVVLGEKPERALESGLLEWVREQNPAIPIACNSIGGDLNFDPIAFAEKHSVPNFQKSYIAFEQFVADLCKAELCKK